MRTVLPGSGLVVCILRPARSKLRSGLWALWRKPWRPST
uniref:Uncharacterized protein n=1 Tax=Arundo donax TaxID=35708 RepID=A0A0A9GN91_ARUDO